MAEMVGTGDNLETLKSRAPQKGLRHRAGWFTLGFAFFMIFTLAKLPSDRIKAYLQSTISNALAPQGITFQADSGEFSLRLGGSYLLKNVSLGFPNTITPITIEEIAVSPSLMSLLRGALGAKIWAENHGGSLEGTAAAKGDTVSVDLSLHAFDFGKLGVLQFAYGLKGSLVLDGNLSLNGSLNAPNTLDGDIGLDVKSLVLDQQSLLGFNIPKIVVSTGKIEAGIDKGKVTLRALKLGKPASLDDIQAVISGDITLQRAIENSVMNLKTRFTLSQTILKSFILIDALLGPGKQPDGSYAFTLSGPMSAPNSTPGN